MRRVVASSLLALVAGVVVAPSAREQERPPDPVATFSILGYDPATGEVGGAVQSRVFSVGNGVLWARGRRRRRRDAGDRRRQLRPAGARAAARRA